MHSHLKTTDHENVHAGYCPLDLFSGNEERISRALRALWDAWIHTQGSANNLRLFFRGKLLKPSDVGDLEQLLFITHHIDTGL
jgi:inositol-pentakisphosphate 2-kinase